MQCLAHNKYLGNTVRMSGVFRLWFLGKRRFALDRKGWLGCRENNEGYIPGSQQRLNWSFIIQSS